MAVDFLHSSTAQLNLDVVLANGQSFRWMREEGDRNSWIGTAHHRLWRLWRPDGNRIEFEILCKFHNESDESEVEKNGADILKEYFQLDVNLGELYQLWASKCAHFKKFMADDPRTYEGIRILRQHPVEALFAFICSANNNIARITKMVEKLCQLYGTSVDLLPNDADGSRRVYDFPSISQLRANLPGMESRLRDAGFGYRAASIAGTVALFSQPEWITKHGEADQWLLSLRQAPYEDAKQALLQLPGVGPKVADCVCLMALDKHAVVPVDTHVFRLTAEIYKPAFMTAKKANRANTANKTAMKYSAKLNPQIGQYYADLFGPYAGWAQSILFTTRLRQFKK